MSTIAKRIDSAVRNDTYALKAVLPPPAERPNPDTVASLDRWILHLPGHHAAWSYYCLTACSLAEYPGVRPAHKQFPEATHEVLVGAINPAFPREHVEGGSVDLLEPLNYVEQFTAADDQVNRLLELLAVEFVNGQLPAEPQGIHGARDRFRELCCAHLPRQPARPSAQETQRPTAFADLGDMDEDKRIAIIGRSVMEGGKTIAFLTDDEPGKPERYIAKLQERFPGIVILERFPGPVAQTIGIKVGPPQTTTAPATVEEYNARFNANQRVEGFGMDTTQIVPCPFCAAPDWSRWKISELAMNEHAPMKAERRCKECGRAGKFLVTRDGGSVQAEFVQTDGPDAPDFMKPKPRRV